MTVVLGISMEQELRDAIRVTAARHGTNPSAWLRALARANIDPGLGTTITSMTAAQQQNMAARRVQRQQPRRYCRHPAKQRLVNVCLACGKTIKPKPA